MSIYCTDLGITPNFILDTAKQINESDTITSYYLSDDTCTTTSSASTFEDVKDRIKKIEERLSQIENQKENIIKKVQILDIKDSNSTIVLQINADWSWDDAFTEFQMWKQNFPNNNIIATRTIDDVKVIQEENKNEFLERVNQ